jgi:oligopeptidase B
VLQVPFVDVINTMLDETLPLTVQEFLEWGNPKKKDEYEYMKSYCPYDNLKRRRTRRCW